MLMNISRGVLIKGWASEASGRSTRNSLSSLANSVATRKKINRRKTMSINGVMLSEKSEAPPLSSVTAMVGLPGGLSRGSRFLLLPAFLGGGRGRTAVGPFQLVLAQAQSAFVAFELRQECRQGFVEVQEQLLDAAFEVVGKHGGGDGHRQPGKRGHQGRPDAVGQNLRPIGLHREVGRLKERQDHSPDRSQQPQKGRHSLRQCQ